MTGNILKFLMVVYFAFLITGCFDKGNGSNRSGEVEETPPPVPTSSIRITSDAGDYVGQGNTFEYSLADAVITVADVGSRLMITIDGDERWSSTFQLPDGYSELQPGSYGDLTRYPFHDPAQGGLSWSGEGRGCNTLTGWLVIDKVVYSDDSLSEVELQFQQHCEGGATALYGEIKWYSFDPTIPPGPVYPAPEELWAPNPEALPESGNYVYLESESGDFIGGGEDYIYTDADIIAANFIDNRVTVAVGGWNGTFQAMNSITQVQQGYYGELQRYPFHNPAKGGVSWSGNGRGCNTLNGWFLVDNVEYTGDTISSINLRFKQHCGNSDPALKGIIHWSK